MSRAEDVWVHQQLEPNEILVTGNAKHHTPLWVLIGKYHIKYPDQKKHITAEEDNRQQDTYLKKHGI